jgi:imidazolonepropionase-like amidohydrolase
MRADGTLGTIAVGSAADLLLVDGDPLKDISIMTDAARLVLIMKGGQIYKNTQAEVRTQRSVVSATASA